MAPPSRPGAAGGAAHPGAAADLSRPGASGDPTRPGAAGDPAATETRFPCPQCGAVLHFLPGTDRLRCRHCRHESVIRPLAAPLVEQDYRQALEQQAAAAPSATRQTVKCDGCAAEFAFDPNVHADRCPYCGSAIVAAIDRHQLITPQALIPFAIPEAAARQALQAWLHGLWFAPSNVKRYARGEGALTGVYVPYWTYDADTESRYAGQRGTTYLVPQTFTARIKGKLVRRQRMVPRIRWTPVRGAVRRRFDDVLVLASRTLPPRLTDDLTPWLQDALVPYQEAYLSGFRSETYQVGLAEGFELAAGGEIAAVIRADIRRDIGGDAQRVHDVQTRYGEISFKHVLLPVWVAAYRYRGKAYQFVVNGQTGEVQGERPYSPLKIALAVGLGLVVAAVVLLVMAAVQGG